MPEWPIPVYIIQGENDHQTDTSLAKTYFDSLEAPRKELFILVKTGHVQIRLLHVPNVSLT